MARIILSGHLADKFGAEWNMEVASVAEAIQALDANTDGFKQALLRKDIFGYHVFLDDSDIDETHIHDPLGGRTIRIVPVIKGSKNFLVAAILIIVAIVLLVVSYGSSSYLSASLVAEGLATEAVAAAVSSAVASLALSLLITGVTSLLAPQKKKDNTGTSESAKNTPSTSFNGAVNTTAQGHPVPLGYGRLIIGSAVISAGLYSDQVSSGTVINGTGGGGADTGGGDGGSAEPLVIEYTDHTGDGLSVGIPVYGKGIDNQDNLSRDLTILAARS